MRYREWTDAGLARKLENGLKVSHDDRWVTFAWTCPVCEDGCTHRLKIGGRIFGLARPMGRRAAPRTTVEVLRCAGDGPYEAQPAGARGCGFWARVPLTIREAR